MEISLEFCQSEKAGTPCFCVLDLESKILYFTSSTNQKKGGLESFPDANLSLITDNRQQVECGVDLLANPRGGVQFSTRI